MAASAVLLVQKNQHLHTHVLSSQKYDPEEGLGRKFPRVMGAPVVVHWDTFEPRYAFSLFECKD